MIFKKKSLQWPLFYNLFSLESSSPVTITEYQRFRHTLPTIYLSRIAAALPFFPKSFSQKPKAYQRKILAEFLEYILCVDNNEGFALECNRLDELQGMASKIPGRHVKRYQFDIFALHFFFF